MKSNPALPKVSPGIGPMITRASGRTTSAAMTPCSVPATTFSIATSSIGAGASRRSSISFVTPKSCTIGKQTDCTADSVRLSASTPGSTVAVYALGIIPIFGRT